MNISKQQWEATPEAKLIIPAYVDEAGTRGLVRDLKPERDHEFGLLCALLFDPSSHDMAIQEFSPAFERFRSAKPPEAKLHITDAFKPGNESWAAVAGPVRAEYIRLIGKFKPIIIYAARRLELERSGHEKIEGMLEDARAKRRSPIKIVGENRPSDSRVEDTLTSNLAISIDGFARQCADQGESIERVDLLFDEVDIAQRYEALIEKTRSISLGESTVRGWDPTQKTRVEGTIRSTIDSPFDIDTMYVGNITVVGKDHPLVLAVDIVTNYLAYHLKSLPPDAPLNAPLSVAEWELKDRVWGVMDGAIPDLV